MLPTGRTRTPSRTNRSPFAGLCIIFLWNYSIYRTDCFGYVAFFSYFKWYENEIVDHMMEHCWRTSEDLFIAFLRIRQPFTE